MICCRICIDDIKKPISLPCGHMFCGECIVKTVQNVKPYTHLHPCPICRSIYNIAPINLNVVPPNLRPFITPNVRRVYLDIPDTSDEGSSKDATLSTAPRLAAESELQRLRAENEALRSNCGMWRKRAEMHGTANLGLINFAKVVRDQAAILARERDDLQTQCRSLKRKVEDIEMAKYSEAALASPLFGDYAFDGNSNKPDPQSLLFAPAFQFSSDLLPVPKNNLKRRREDTFEDESTDPNASASTSTSLPNKRVKVDNLVSPSHRTKPTAQGLTSPKETSSLSQFHDPCA